MCLATLTNDIQELGEGFGGHQLFLVGLEHPLRGLVDGHVVVPHVLCQREGPASLRVAGGYFL